MTQASNAAAPENRARPARGRPSAPRPFPSFARSGEDPQWQVSPSLLRGWREVVSFDNSGAAIIGDFTVARSADVRVAFDNQFFMQVLLDGHDILPPAAGARALPAAKVILGRLRADSDVRFILPTGGRWRSLFIGISDRAARHMWDMEPERLMDVLWRSESNGESDGANAFECSSRLPLERLGTIERTAHGSLPKAQRMAFIWSRSLELMVDTVSNALAEAQRGSAVYSRGRASVLAARDIVHDEIALPHTIDSLSFRVGLSRRDFMRAFKEQFGTTFHDYYMEVRMARAANLLSEGRRRIGEVSKNVGYTQLSSFSRAFKAFYGVPPCAFGNSERYVGRSGG